MKYKISWYQNFDPEPKKFYTCANCNHEVDIKDLYCRSCGMNFITGETPKDKYRKGYEDCKNDIIKLLNGGKIK